MGVEQEQYQMTKSNFYPNRVSRESAVVLGEASVSDSMVSEAVPVGEEQDEV